MGLEKTLNQANIQDYLQEAEKKLLDIYKDMNYYEDEKTEAEAAIEESEENKRKYSKILEEAKSTIESLSTELTEAENELNDCLAQKKDLDSQLNRFSNDEQYIDLLKRLSSIKHEIRKNHPDVMGRDNNREKWNSLMSQEKQIKNSINEIEKKKPYLKKARVNIRLLIDALKTMELRIRNLREKTNDIGKQIDKYKRVIRALENSIKKEEENIERSSNRKLAKQGLINSKKDKAKRLSEEIDLLKELLSNEGHVYEIEGSNYRIRIKDISTRGNDNVSVRFEFAPESSDKFVMSFIQCNESQVIKRILEIISKEVPKKKKTGEEEQDAPRDRTNLKTVEPEDEQR